MRLVLFAVRTLFVLGFLDRISSKDQRTVYTVVENFNFNLMQ